MKTTILIFTLCLAFVSSKIFAQSEDELAQQLANPIASLISVPFQNNFDFNVGANGGFKYTLNMQPVVPISVGENWNMISRTIVPVIYQNDVIADNSSQSGIGDLVQSLFFSPKVIGESGIIWGAGPVLLLPTATNSNLGFDKWGAGPTAVALKSSSKWTYGILANHIFSFGGINSSSDINASFFQPFISLMLGKGLSLALASENTQSWNNDIFSGIAGVYANKVLKMGSQTLQLGGGPKIIYSSNNDTGFGFRLNVVLLFPK